MGRALIDPENSVPKNMWGCLAAAVLLPIFTVLKLVTMPFDKPRRLSPDEVGAMLRKFIDGTASDGEIDYFISVDIADPVLNDVKDEVGILFGLGWDDEETKARLREQLRRVDEMI
jgi:hypothetical protein